MIRVLREFFQDVSQYHHVASHLRSLRKEGQGIDFRTEQPLDLQRRVLARLHPARMRLQVDEVIEETATTRTFRTHRVDGELPPFRAGQYVNVHVEVGGVRTSRPYSISSAPGVDHLDLTVRDVPDGFVAPYLLTSVEVGDHLESSGPTGCFYHEPLSHGDDLVFLAGGSGITPLMSMLRDWERRDWPCKVTLLYGSRHPDDVVFDAELHGMARGNGRFSMAMVFSEPSTGFRGKRGLLDADRIGGELDDLDGKAFYVCGPAAMYDLCLPALLELGVPRYRIKRELYGPPADITQVPGWPEGLAADAPIPVRVGDRTIEAVAGEPLLCSLERHGLAPPSVCRSGECSLCRTRLLAGEVFLPPGAGLREADRRHGYIHPCVSYPVSEIAIRIPE